MTAPEPYGPTPAAPADPAPHGHAPMPAKRRRLRPVHLAVSAGSLVAGVAVAVAVLLLAGWRHVPVSRYEVRVLLAAAAPAEQVEAVRAELSRTAGGREVRVRTPEENYADLRKTYTDSGDTLPSSVTPESMPRAVVTETTGRDFDCAPYTAVKGLAGVDSVRIGQYDGDVPVAATTC